ncbi:unnamed protein product [Linum trigynum]|uniref:Uncharacterized protein n=1 Tax=Linum trigynum TaxID=586398 RepID=A0AAV2CQT3_9ROSI
MRCSIDESIYSFVSAASTARAAWLTLEKLYASNAQSRIIYLKGKLAKTSKGDHDILSFVNDLKTTATELALIGEPVKDIDLIAYCLRGLGAITNPSLLSFVPAVLNSLLRIWLIRWWSTRQTLKLGCLPLFRRPFTHRGNVMAAPPTLVLPEGRHSPTTLSSPRGPAGLLQCPPGPSHRHLPGPLTRLYCHSRNWPSVTTS